MKMASHPEIKWSEVVRSILEQQVKEMDEAERLSAGSKLTEKDVEELASKIDDGIAARWKRAARG